MRCIEREKDRERKIERERERERGGIKRTIRNERESGGISICR